MGRKEIHSGWSWYEAAKDNADYNFVSVAYTPWHAIGIDALIRYLEDKGIRVNAAIVITAHPVTGYALDESFFTNSCATYYYDDSKRSPQNNNTKPSGGNKVLRLLQYYRMVLSKNSKGRELYYVTNSYAVMHWVRKIQGDLHKKVIIAYTEEGVASYIGTLKDPNVIPIKNIKSFQKYIRYQLIGYYLYQLIHKSVCFKMFDRTIFGLRLNKSILPYYRNAIQMLTIKKGLEVNKNEITNSYIICTTAWQRNCIQNDVDLYLLSDVCQYLQRKGANVLLKTHPRDNYFKKHIGQLGASLLDASSLPMECICAESKPLGIISFSSTILVTASVFWDIPTYCISDMLDRSKVDAVYQEEMDKFKNTFYSYTHFIKRLDEIR